MHELIVSPFLGNYIVVRPGRRNGIKIPYIKYQEFTQVIPGEPPRVREILDLPAPLEPALTTLQHRQLIRAHPREPGHPVQGQPTKTADHPGPAPDLDRLPAHRHSLGHRASPHRPRYLQMPSFPPGRRRALGGSQCVRSPLREGP